MSLQPVALLDLGNVLLDFDFARFARAASALCAHAPEDILRRVVDTPLKRDFDSGRVSESDFLNAACGALGISNAARDAVRRAWADLFRIVPGAEAAYAAIEARADIWILSDTDPIHHRWALEHFPFVGRAQGFIASYEVGALKRDGRPFEVALERIGVPPVGAVFLDDREENVAIASARGFPAIRFVDWQSSLAAVLRELDAIEARQ